MAEIPPDYEPKIWDIQKQLLKIISDARTLEYQIFIQFGENEQTLTSLNELSNVTQEGIVRFRKFANMELQAAHEPESLSSNLLELIIEAVNEAEAKIPALQRSIEEVTREWR